MGFTDCLAELESVLNGRKKRRREDARAPENEDEKTGGTNRAASAASTVATGDGQPASARRSGGPTADRAHAGGGSAGTRPACRASIGAAQRRPCSEPRPAARSRSKASGASLARAARRGSAEPGACPERRVSAARYPTYDMDKDRLPLVILSSGVQEGRPFYISWHFGPNPPRAGELDAETRRGISATGDATR